MKHHAICWFTTLLLFGCSAATTTGDGESVATPDATVGADGGAVAGDVADRPDQQGGTKDDVTGGDPGAPIVSILSPEEDAVFNVGEPTDFEASVGDPDGGLAGLTYLWESDRDGELLSGDVEAPTLLATIDDLSPGSHTVTLTVSDADGLEGADTVAIFVNQPPTGQTLVSIVPDTPVTTDSLTAVIVDPAIDPDGDLVTYTFTWFVDDLAAGVSGDTVPAQETASGQVWRVTALPGDADSFGEAGEASVTIGNSAPTLETVTIIPSAGYTDTTFSCETEGWSDADDDPQVLQTTWHVNDTEVPDQTEPTLSSEHFIKGDTVQCAVTPSDAVDAGQQVFSNLAPVLDTPPSVQSATLSPESGDKNTVFTCAGDTPEDKDGDVVTLGYVWLHNGVELPGTTSDTSEGISLERGDTLQCKIAPVADGVEGTPADSQVITIGNAIPLLGAVIMTPSPATELTDIQCVLSNSSDPDGDNLAISYIWYVNDVIVEGQTGPSLSGAYFDKGDTVLCEVMAYDGEDMSEPEPSKDSIDVVNSPPTVDGASIDPPEGSIQTSFTCVPGQLTDPDPGDVVTAATSWRHDDVEVPGGIFETLVPGELGPGVLTCVVTPNDGTDDGAPVTSTPATVVNNAPSIDSVTVSPQPATSSDTLTCTPNGWDDLDGDPEGYLYAWSVAGVTLDDAHDATLSSEHFAKGDPIICIVTPTDGLDSGETMYSQPLIISNSPPSVTAAAILPVVGGKLTEFTCLPAGADDPDAGDLDNLVFAYTWTIDGALVVGAETKNFTPGSGVTTDANLTCTVTPYDLLSYGEPVTSGPALITNQAPQIGSAIITPGDGGLHCVPQEVTDLDEDAVTVAYSWLVNGLVQDGETDAFLSSDGLAADDAVRCVVTPNDGTIDGQPVMSDPYLFDNNGPTTPTVTVGPVGAAPGDPLTCTAVATDPDDDDLTYSYTWLLDGAEQTAYTQATLPGGVTGACDTWTCEATASDGEATSPVGSDSLTLGSSGGGIGGGHVWFGEHSAPGGATAGDVQLQNQFLLQERVATRITVPDSAALTHVRFYGLPGSYIIALHADGSVPQGTPLASSSHLVTTQGMQVATLDTPVEIDSGAAIWVVLHGLDDWWYAAGDTDGRDTDNIIYGCVGLPGFGCITPPSWTQYETYSWGSWGDIVADVGYATGGGPASCD